MSEQQQVKKGDHVKVTIEGEVNFVYSDGDFELNGYEFSPNDGVTIEKIVPPIKNGDVFEDGSGVRRLVVPGGYMNLTTGAKYPYADYASIFKDDRLVGNAKEMGQ